MGLEPFNVSSALNLVLAQRLLRRICGNCKEQYKLSAEEMAAARWTDKTTLRELRFSDESIDGLKSRAPDDVKPLLAKITLDTRVMDMPFFRGKGCDQCKGSGSRGRQGAYEVLNMTPGLRKLILQNVGAAEIKDFGIEEGMLTLRMDGLVKVWKGITTMEQVITETSA
jgi:type IV pilus assembly protein PilB